MSNIVATVVGWAKSFLGLGGSSSEKTNELNPTEHRRKKIKAEIQSRLGELSDETGSIIDYDLWDVSQTLSPTDAKLVFVYNSEKFGKGRLFLDPPEPGESWSELHGFMAHLGLEAVDDLDGTLGKEINLTREDGTVKVVWEDPKDSEGKVYVNQNAPGTDTGVVDPAESSSDETSNGEDTQDSQRVEPPQSDAEQS